MGAIGRTRPFVWVRGEMIAVESGVAIWTTVTSRSCLVGGGAIVNSSSDRTRPDAGEVSTADDCDVFVATSGVVVTNEFGDVESIVSGRSWREV